MTIEHKGSARMPGPLDFYSGKKSGRIPGPLWDKQVVGATPAATKAARVLPMPGAAGGIDIGALQILDSPLFPSNGTPAPTDVVQGQLANCPVASILAALANTTVGQNRIHDLVTESMTAVETDLTDVPDKLKLPKGEKLISHRYFSVTLEGKVFEVSDVFYTDDADRGTWSLIFMGAPPLGAQGSDRVYGRPKIAWPSAIEKGYALKVNGYEDLDDDVKHTVNQFWEVLLGAKPQGFTVDDSTDLNRIRDVARAARTVPAIGASKDSDKRTAGILNHHGFAILGMEGSNVQLYDPRGRMLKVSLTDCRQNFQAIFYGNPVS